GFLGVEEKRGVGGMEGKGKKEESSSADKSPTPPLFLNDIEAVTMPMRGTVLYVSDSGNLKGGGGAVYRIDPKRKVTTLVDTKKHKQIHTPNGLFMSSEYHLHLLDFGSVMLARINLDDRATTKVANG